jgi:hypothetical protein
MNKYDWEGSKPNWTKLPREVREGLGKKIELAPHETYANVQLFKAAQNLKHPNARIRSGPYQKSMDKPVDGVLIDSVTHTGRDFLYNTVISLDKFPHFLYHLIKSYLRSSGKFETIEKIIEDIKNEHRL